ncbi:MAG: hypothetical protein V5A88_08200 [Candidatus Thermoplasmatota archaeon]
MTTKDAFERIVNVIEKIREPGEKPEDDLYSLDKFVCDLCQGVREREGITQCGFCGRWVCKDRDTDEEKNDCWNEDLKACESCSGLILLAQKDDLKGESDLMEENDTDENSDEGDKDE